MAINFGGNLYAWNDGREIALWAVGGVLLLLFAVQQAFAIGTTIEKRIFPADFLRMKIMWILFALMNAAATCVFVCNALFKLIQLTWLRSLPSIFPSTFSSYMEILP